MDGGPLSGCRQLAGLSATDFDTTCLPPLTCDLRLDNVLENASVIEHRLGHEAHRVHRPRIEPVNYMEALGSVYRLGYSPVTITYTEAKHNKCTSSESQTVIRAGYKDMLQEWKLQN